MIEVKDKKTIAPLFAGWADTMIWSCLQDCMGRAWADGEKAPRSARIDLGDFYYFAGEPDPELVRNKKADYVIMVARDAGWYSLIEQIYKERATRQIRYAIKKEGDIFDRALLGRYAAALPAGYALSFIDEEMYREILTLPWARDLCANFRDYEEFRLHGLGVVARRGKEILSGAGTFSYYRGGIEIEIDTRRDERRKGLALACGAKLLLLCLERGLYPSWDAHNRGSVALAEKLGYHFDREYPVYEVVAKG